jgi:hypothetical protein
VKSAAALAAPGAQADCWVVAPADNDWRIIAVTQPLQMLTPNLTAIPTRHLDDGRVLRAF